MGKRRKRKKRDVSVEEQARRNVGRRIGFLAHGVVYGSTLLLLLVTAPLRGWLRAIQA